MTPIRLSALLILYLGLSACAPIAPEATRNRPVDDAAGKGLAATASVSPADAPAGTPAYAIVMPRYLVARVDVLVPKSLQVSEADVPGPMADIVWHGEPRGDRYQQVAAIFDVALARGVAPFATGQPVIVEAEVTRFRGPTAASGSAAGGTSSVRFNLTVRDAETGAIVDGPRLVVADMSGPGNGAIPTDDADGRMQKRLVGDHLAQVIARELARPLAVPAEGLAAARRAFAPSRATF